ncbi:hypothetical protein V3C99_006843 [Haemonchus contortus]
MELRGSNANGFLAGNSNGTTITEKTQTLTFFTVMKRAKRGITDTVFCGRSSRVKARYAGKGLDFRFITVNVLEPLPLPVDIRRQSVHNKQRPYGYLGFTDLSGIRQSTAPVSPAVSSGPTSVHGMYNLAEGRKWRR